MKIDVKFSEIIQEFKPSFGAVQTASDGGFERGYAKGYEQGNKRTAEIIGSLLSRTITEYADPDLTTLGAYALSGTAMTQLDLPSLKTIAGMAFYECNGPTEMVFPLLESIPYNGLRQFRGLVKADFWALQSILQNGFYGCTALETLIIRTNAVCSLVGGTVLNNSKIASGTGYIYVPDDLVDSYKAATNWSAYADQIKPLSELEETV